MSTTTTSLTTSGLYTVPESARLIGVPARQVRRWLGLDSGTHPVVTRTSDADEQLVSFRELLELKFVQMFRQEGVSLHTIRKAATAAANKFGTDHPFAVHRFDTDGKSIFATLRLGETDQEIVEELSHGQLVFEQVIKPFFRKLDYDGTVIRYWPLSKSGRILLDPERRFGRPIDSETGVPVETILNALQAGGGQEPKQVAEWLGLPLSAIDAALKFDRLLAS